MTNTEEESVSREFRNKAVGHVPDDDSNCQESSAMAANGQKCAWGNIIVPPSAEPLVTICSLTSTSRYGPNSFTVSGLISWNSLPPSLCNPSLLPADDFTINYVDIFVMSGVRTHAKVRVQLSPRILKWTEHPFQIFGECRVDCWSTMYVTEWPEMFQRTSTKNCTSTVLYSIVGHLFFKGRQQRTDWSIGCRRTTAGKSIWISPTLHHTTDTVAVRWTN